MNTEPYEIYARGYRVLVFDENDDIIEIDSFDKKAHAWYCVMEHMERGCRAEISRILTSFKAHSD